MMTLRSTPFNGEHQPLLHQRLTLILVAFLSLCITAQAYAWTGEIQGVLNLDQRDIVISGSGKWSDQQELSLLGSAYLPSGRRLVIKVELNEAELGRELSLDNPNIYLII